MGEQAGEKDSCSSFFLSWRFGLAIIGFFGFMNVYAVRIGMSVGIVCMVNHTALRVASEETIQGPWNFSTGNVSYAQGNQDDSRCVATVNNKTEPLDGSYVWEKTIQGHILGAFFYGYLVSQIPGGFLAEKVGGKWVFAGAMLITAIGTLLTPLAAQLHYGALIGIRVLMGIGSGATYPVFHSIWSRWAPPLERSKLANMTYAGAWLGSVIALPLSGLLCRYGFAGGWPSIFYILGVSCLLWTVLWLFLASDSPADHRFMKQEEKDYIMSTLVGQVSSGKDQHKGGVPWRKIFTSMPVWANVMGNICSDWGLYIYITQIPTYMKEVLKFDVESNGFLSALPFVGLWINMNISPLIADKLRSSNTCSTANVRRIFMSFGCLGAAISLTILAFVDCSMPQVAVMLLTIGLTASASVYSGFMISHMDIAPKYAGTLFGLSNCCASATGFVAPYVVAVMTPNGTEGEWRSVFLMAAAVYTFGAIFYDIFVSGEIQEWAKEKEEPEAEEMKCLDGRREDSTGNGVNDKLVADASA